MVKNQIDLHLHSWYSDGRLSPEELVRECKKAGLKVIALTDHDHVGGVSAAIAEGKRNSIKVIPGIEFSTDYEGVEYHVLGMGINRKASYLQEFLELCVETKKEQIAAMVDVMKGEGFIITMDDVLKEGKGALNRAHIAYAIMARLKENQAALRKFGISSLGDPSSDIFKMFLKEGAFGYRNRRRPTIEEVINLIQWLDGVAIWAHSTWKDDMPEIRRKAALFQTFGLDGLEIGYSRDHQTVEQTLALHQIAQELSLLETAGSDFHSLTMPVYNQIANYELPPNIELNLPAFLFPRET